MASTLLHIIICYSPRCKLCYCVLLYGSHLLQSVPSNKADDTDSRWFIILHTYQNVILHMTSQRIMRALLSMELLVPWFLLDRKMQRRESFSFSPFSLWLDLSVSYYTSISFIFLAVVGLGIGNMLYSVEKNLNLHKGREIAYTTLFLEVIILPHY